ncbi:hypothetical protein GCM10009775_05870 [Microbacterium aoyamense]|uniref:Uncharacterized protein n=1 Tax=Microbacterium aoyamense TaxID=344166 RepID=A0ABN2P9S1_9MICO|nr:hypothetical protein [Microbacterium aoyamense]
MTKHLDLTGLPRFLAHLEARDASSAHFARLLLDSGCVPVGFWGPVQMDVWELRIRRGAAIVRFGVERGYSDGLMIGPPTGSDSWTSFVPMNLAVVAWAGANAYALRLDDPSVVNVDLQEVGLAVVDWVGDGHEEAIDRVRQAWKTYHEKEGRLRRRTNGHPTPAQLNASRAAGAAAMQAAATPST